MTEPTKPSNNGQIPAESDGRDLVPQPHGGALLRKGHGQIGNRGGGRPPSIVRERARNSFYERINTLETIADKPYTEDRDRIKAIDTLGKYGLTTGRLDIEEVRNRLARTIARIEELADPDTANRILTAIDPIWNPTR